MKYKLVKLSQFSGNKASIYTVKEQKKGEINNNSLFDNFIIENKSLFLSEIKDIFSRLKTIGHETGARESFFKTKEGIPGDGVCALYDSPKKNLRLYCIRYGKELVVIGGGGYKPKNIRSLQEDEKLEIENYILRKLSIRIKECMRDGDLSFSLDYMDFVGELLIKEYGEEE